MTQLVKASDKRGLVRTWFEQALPEIQKAAPKHIDPQRLIRVALTACIQNPKLLDCTRESLMRSLLQAAQLGLEPDGLLGQAYLIPFEIASLLLLAAIVGAVVLAKRRL